jgi:hypothetical protein
VRRLSSGLAAQLPVPKLAQHDRPSVRWLLKFDQELSESPGLWADVELADPTGAIEVEEHQNVKQLGMRRSSERGGCLR